MKEKKFQKYLACYGADLNRWPRPLMKQAQKSLGESKSLQFLLTEAHSLETLMQSDTPTIPSEEWLSNIVSQARRTPQNSARARTIDLLSQWKQKLMQPLPALALTTCLVIGIVTGLLTRNQIDDSNNGTEWASLLYDEEVLLWDESSN